MVKPEKFDHFHLVFHFTVPLKPFISLTYLFSFFCFFSNLSSILCNVIQLTTYNKKIINNDLLIKEQPRT